MYRLTLVTTISFLLAVTQGCDDDVVPPTPETYDTHGTLVEEYVPTPPRPSVASPHELAIGEALTISGESFIKPIHGTLKLKFVGNFVDDTGQSFPVQYEGDAEFLNETKIKWDMWPDVVFAPTKDKLGRFVGSLTVVNRPHKDGDDLESTPLSLSITIKPSLIPRVIQPQHKGCALIVERVRENTPMTLSVEALGLRAGTVDAPLSFNWHFPAVVWKVAFNHGALDPSSIVNDPKKTYVIVDRVTEGLRSTVTAGQDRNLVLKVKDDLLGEEKLTTLQTFTLPKEGNQTNSMPIAVLVTVTDATGKEAKVALKMTLGRAVDLIYDGTAKVAERRHPVEVTDCIPGDSIGREASYHDTKSESHHRSYTFNYNGTIGSRLGLPSNPFALGLDISAGFGVMINESVSVDNTKSFNFSGQILPGQYGVFRRQTTKLLRIAKLVGYTECGQPMELGDAKLVDWTFAYEMAVGPACLPPTNFPPAETFYFED